MSDLQIVLMIVGGLIIVAVLVYNWWQERRFHQQVENTFSNIKSDALLEEPTLVQEPTLDSTVLYETQDHHDAFSIQHDAMHEAPPPLAENQDSDDVADQAYEQAPDFSAPPATPIPAMQELMEATDLPHADTDVLNIDNTEAKPVNHDGIKAIFQDAFSKSLNTENTVRGNPEPLHSQHDAAEHEATPPSLPLKLHAEVDLIAVLHLTSEMTADEIANAMKQDFDSYDKPVFIHLFTPDSRWILLSDAVSKPELARQKISKAACSLQLADRAGPVPRSILNRFQMAVESLGLDINAHVEWQRTTDPAADAAALDAFCIDVDKTMGFHLLHGENGAFTGTKLRGLAEAQGLELAADGSFKYYDEAVKKQVPSAPMSPSPSFIMFNRDHYPFSPDMLRQSVVKGITFQLDIPHVPNCTEAFNHMVLVAKQMETGLHAQLVDDNNKPLGDVQIEKIRHQLKIIQATMLARGIAPGSDVAQRLFS